MARSVQAEIVLSLLKLHSFARFCLMYILISNRDNSTTYRCLLTIYEAFVRPHLEYADLTYEKSENESFKDWLDKIQYSAVLTITGVIRG